jgi:hypothetical protein
MSHDEAEERWDKSAHESLEGKEDWQKKWLKREANFTKVLADLVNKLREDGSGN